MMQRPNGKRQEEGDDWRIFKRAHDARNKQAIFYIYTVDVALKDESRAPKDARPTPDLPRSCPGEEPAPLPDGLRGPQHRDP